MIRILAEMTAGALLIIVLAILLGPPLKYFAYWWTAVWMN